MESLPTELFWKISEFLEELSTLNLLCVSKSLYSLRSGVCLESSIPGSQKTSFCFKTLLITGTEEYLKCEKVNPRNNRNIKTIILKDVTHSVTDTFMLGRMYVSPKSLYRAFPNLSCLIFRDVYLELQRTGRSCVPNFIEHSFVP